MTSVADVDLDGCMPHMLFGLFVSKITQKLLNRFPLNLYGGWVSAQNRPNLLLERILKRD